MCLQVHPQELNNGVINSCFLLLFKDLIKLYACYNDGIINLLGKGTQLSDHFTLTGGLVKCWNFFCPEKFFQMKRSQCKDGLEIYKRFLTRMTRVSEFFKIAEVSCRTPTDGLFVCVQPFHVSVCVFAASGNRQK